MANHAARHQETDDTIDTGRRPEVTLETNTVNAAHSRGRLLDLSLRPGSLPLKPDLGWQIIISNDRKGQREFRLSFHETALLR